MSPTKPFQAMVAALICVISAPAAHALTIDFATGQDASGTVQSADDALDANWIQSGALYPQDLANTYVLNTDSADSAIGTWAADDSTSAWIAPNPNSSSGGYTDGSVGSYDTVIYTYVFDLSGTDLTTAAFSGGSWGVDNSAVAFLNGVQIDSSGGGALFSLVSFDLPVADLTAGANVLTVDAVGDYASNAFRLAGELTVDVPEPGTFALLGAGLVVLCAAHRRRTIAA